CPLDITLRCSWVTSTSDCI
ncbi:hypothetical protein OPQ81_011139, partial [Rhizoctonia solani]